MVRTTAILLENYMNHLQKDPALIAEDRISTSDFKGVNLALLGLIRRAMPTLVGSDLVGIQAMPTPTSPLFYMSWRKSMSEGTVKGASQSGQEFHGYPSDGTQPLEFIDPFFTGSLIRNAVVATSASSGSYHVQTSWAPIINRSVKLTAYDADGSVVGSAHINANTPQIGTAASSSFAGVITAAQIATSGTVGVYSASYLKPVISVTINAGVEKIVASWEYNQESNPVSPELSINIQEFTLKLIRRMLRGKFSIDSISDAKAYHGISLENEMMEIMKFELTNEINREIINDLRNMAAIGNSVDYTAAVNANTIGNYDDTFKYVLDAVNGLAAEIQLQTRLGRGNFVVGNPVTLAFLDRVPGFVGSGVSYDGKGLGFSGNLGKRLNFYVDPQYPKNELLIGYKGSSALDTGYIHAPYLPITATPTLYNPETGDPSKIFYTRYSKTYRDVDYETGLPYNAIYRGEYCYARLFLNNFPTI
jgi:hypothetical protein